MSGPQLQDNLLIRCSQHLDSSTPPPDTGLSMWLRGFESKLSLVLLPQLFSLSVHPADCWPVLVTALQSRAVPIGSDLPSQHLLKPLHILDANSSSNSSSHLSKLCFKRNNIKQKVAASLTPGKDAAALSHESNRSSNHLQHLSLLLRFSFLKTVIS